MCSILSFDSVKSWVLLHCWSEILAHFPCPFIHFITTSFKRSRQWWNFFFIHCHIKRNSKSQVPVGLVSSHRLLQTGDQFEIPTVSSPHTTNTLLSMFTFYFIFQSKWRSQFEWSEQYFNPCGSHSSVVSSAPTILRPRVWIPSTPSMLFSICIIEIVSRK